VYQAAHAYSWTRLGYTYNWRNPDREIGLSEFIILGGSTIEIRFDFPL
jgi:hypothetical protein